jgi:hypothetical protein
MRLLKSKAHSRLATTAMLLAAMLVSAGRSVAQSSGTQDSPAQASQATPTPTPSPLPLPAQPQEMQQSGADRVDQGATRPSDNQPSRQDKPPSQIPVTPAQVTKPPVTRPAVTKPRVADIERPATVVPGPFIRNLAFDQKTIWTSPFRARVRDLNWIVPIVGLTAGLINADHELSSRIDPTGTLAKHGSTLSNGGLAVAVAGGAGLYLMGKVQDDDHKRETGILAGEAAVNSVIVVEALKAVTRRDRPEDNAGKGEIFHGSVLNSSFPSLHAITTWSIASVIAHEYPGVLTQTLSYGVATGVSLSRVYAQKHFPSDVVAGAAMGYLIGRQVYSAHHQSDLPGGDYGSFHTDLAREAQSP